MSKAIHNFEEIKIKYLEGQIVEVQDFLKTTLGLPKKSAENGYWKEKTKGWRGERKALLEAQTQVAKDRFIENGKAQISNVKLLQAKNQILRLVATGLTEFASIIEYDRDLQPILNKNASGLKIFWEMIKLELGEPTTIARNDNKTESESESKLAEAILKLADAKNKQSK